MDKEKFLQMLTVRNMGAVSNNCEISGFSKTSILSASLYINTEKSKSVL